MTEHDVAALAQRVHDAERMNFGTTSTRDERNKNWARIAGIVHHGHPAYNSRPDPRWHIKDAGGGRPQSDDVLAFKDTRMMIDFIGGAGAANYTFRAGHWEGPLGPEQNIYAPPVPEGGTVVQPPPVASPYWTAAHTTLMASLLQKHAPNASGDEGFVRIVAEQFAHSFPGEGWGMKRADPTRPLSNNVAARQITTGLVGFRVVPATTTPAQIDLRGQAFEAVTPTNHLGAVITPPPPVDPPVDPPPPPPVDPPPAAAPCDLAPVLEGLTALAAKVDKQRQDVIDAVREQSYDVDLGWMKGTVKPRKRKEPQA